MIPARGERQARERRFEQRLSVRVGRAVAFHLLGLTASAVRLALPRALARGLPPRPARAPRRFDSPPATRSGGLGGQVLGRQRAPLSAIDAIEHGPEMRAR